MSLLKKADNLLKNPQTRRDDLEELLADLTIALTTNSEMPKDVKTRYAENIVKLNARLGYSTENPVKTKETKKIYEKDSQQNRLQPIKNLFIQASRSTIDEKFNYEQISFYSQGSFLPYDLKPGNQYWLDLSDYYVRQFCRSSLDNGLSIFNGRAQIVFSNERPDLWLGDLKIKGERKVEGRYAWQDELIVFDAEAVINYKRVGALFQHYDKVEHLIRKQGELGWTMNTPILAHKSAEPQRMRSSFGFRSRSYDDVIHPSAEYIVKIGGFVVFISGLSEDMIKNKSVFDFEYLRDNPRGTSGVASFRENPVREIIMEEGNIQRYRQMEKEGKFK